MTEMIKPYENQRRRWGCCFDGFIADLGIFFPSKKPENTRTFVVNGEAVPIKPELLGLLGLDAGVSRLFSTLG